MPLIIANFNLIFKSILQFLIIIVPVLLSIATLTLAERKIMAAIQIRRGPNVIGYGILQPLADGLKLLIKELVIPLKGNKFLFLFAPILFLSLSFTIWGVIPFENYKVSSSNLAVLVFLGLSSLSVYGLLLGGWSSNSRYAFLGAIRSASQMISYELILGLIIMFTIISSGSYNFIDLMLSQNTVVNLVLLLPIFLIFLVVILSETNRTPFDLTEAEAELVAGYSVEYSSAPFAFYFIAEYGNLIIWSHVTAIIFFGGWSSSEYLIFLPIIMSFMLKSFTILIFFCWTRATFPRYRFDQLLILAWRFYLPIVLAFVLIIAVGFRLFMEDFSIFTGDSALFWGGILLTKVSKISKKISKFINKVPEIPTEIKNMIEEIKWVSKLRHTSLDRQEYKLYSKLKKIILILSIMSYSCLCLLVILVPLKLINTSPELFFILLTSVIIYSLILLVLQKWLSDFWPQRTRKMVRIIFTLCAITIFLVVVAVYIFFFCK